MERFPRLVLSMSLLVLASCGGEPASPSAPGPSPVASTAASGSTGGVPVWTRPPDPMALAQAAGLTPDVKEYLDYHIHAHLDVFLDGQQVVIPGGIGIETADPAVQQFGEDGFGGIPEEGCEQACISPLHTHDIDGVIHIEAPLQAGFTLGQFFEEMAIRLDASCVDTYCAPATTVVTYVDGLPHPGNPADIIFRDVQEIAIVIGTPPEVIPNTFPAQP